MLKPLKSKSDPRYWQEQMVAVACNRDRDSFMRIYEHFMPRVYRYLKGLGCAEMIAEELAQEALLRLWQRAESYKAERSHLGTWLFRIARNLHIDRVRREPYWMALHDEQANPDPDDITGSRCASSPEAFTESTRLQRTIDQLPAMQARLIRMSYFEAKSHGEIAAEMNMPLGTVKSNLRRAFLKLQAGIRGRT